MYLIDVISAYNAAIISNTFKTNSIVCSYCVCVHWEHLNLLDEAMLNRLN